MLTLTRFIDTMVLPTTTSLLLYVISTPSIFLFFMLLLYASTPLGRKMARLISFQSF